MTHHDERSHSGEKLVHAYNRMMERIKVALEEAGKEGRPTLNHLITTAKEKAVQLGEITQEEADKIGDYLKRDLEDAAAYMASTEAQDFGSWLKFDIRLIEERLLEMFTSVADKTTLELMEFTEGANRYQTG